MDIQTIRGRERELSPDRAKVCMQPRSIKAAIKKVQVVYYLSRNGQLEHPHYMEVSHLANQHLRLKDVMERLVVLRGKGMPSLYSWSCKRSYKNGYVWNDLAENDVIYPSDGAEYVLKGSELVDGCSESFRQLQVSHNRLQVHKEPNDLHEKKRQHSLMKYEAYEDYEEQQPPRQQHQQEEESSQEEFELDEEKISYTSSTTPHSRCSRGVSTDELEELQPNKNPAAVAHDSPSNANTIDDKKGMSISQRFEDGDPVMTTDSITGRNSVLLQLISCGNLTMVKAKNRVGPPQQVQSTKQDQKPNCRANTNNTVIIRRSESSNLHKGVLYRTAIKEAHEHDMINYMSENPRFGNPQADEKEYFSGSILESMSDNLVVPEPTGLKRSNSYNEERCSKAGLEGAVKEEIIINNGEKPVKGKCMPLKKYSTISKQVKK